jgi:adsorption protein B
MLWRDRKSVAAALLTVAAYFCGRLVTALEALRDVSPAVAAFPEFAPAGGTLRLLLTVNLLLLAWRLAMRVLFTHRVYGAVKACLAIPRVVVGNGINFLAALRALRRYVGTARGRRPQVWEKTAHRFPGVPAE